jgi:hypothetical protein
VLSGKSTLWSDHGSRCAVQVARLEAGDKPDPRPLPDLSGVVEAADQRAGLLEPPGAEAPAALDICSEPDVVNLTGQLASPSQAPSDEWVSCDTCNKWRRLPPSVKASDLPDQFFCNMNAWNHENTCAVAEETALYG